MKKSLFDRAELLIKVHKALSGSNDLYKANLRPEDLLWILGWPWFWPEPFSALTHTLMERGYVLVPLAERVQLFRLDAITHLRKLPSGKGQIVLDDHPELEGKSAEIIRQLYVTRFNNKPRGPFYAYRSDIAAICGVPLLTPNVIYALSRELDQLPLARPQKTVIQGYTLIDALDYIAVVEKKRVFRNPVLTRQEIKDALSQDKESEEKPAGTWEM